MNSSMTAPLADRTRTRSGPRSGWSAALRRKGLSPLVLVSMTFLLLLGICAVAPGLVAPHEYDVQRLQDRLIPPSWIGGGSTTWLLGTDQLGRDMLSRIVFAARVSVVVALSAVCLSGFVGVLLGLTAGFVGGLTDAAVMGVAEVQLAFPFVLLAISVIAIAGPSLPILVVVLALSGWMTFAKVMRAEVLKEREKDYVLAASAIGCSQRRIMFRHVLPQPVSLITVIATIEVARVVLLESALSFLGLGVQPPSVSWGQMLSDGRGYLATAWWVSAFSGLAITATVLALNVFGEWLGDLLDPAAHARGASQ